MLNPKYLKHVCIILLSLFSMSVIAGEKNGTPVSYYFGYYLENSIDSSTISILESEGYQIIETDSNEKILYVKTSKCSKTPKQLESKLKKVVYLGSNKKQQEQKSSTQQKRYQDFDFLNVFFFYL